MLLTCTLATVAQLCNCNPQPGHVIHIPAAYVAELTRAEISRAKRCARDLRLRWRIVD